MGVVKLVLLHDSMYYRYHVDQPLRQACTRQGSTLVLLSLQSLNEIVWNIFFIFKSIAMKIYYNNGINIYKPMENIKLKKVQN